VFPPGLRDHQQVKELFVRGLELVNNALSNEPLLPLFGQIMAALQGAAHPPSRTPVHSVHVKPEPTPPKPRLRDDEDADMSFRDIVEQFAAINNISFAPNVKRGRHEVTGKPIYLFGKVNVYLVGERRAIYAKEKDSNDWRPVALDALLQRATDG
jgi:hypothetical protein